MSRPTGSKNKTGLHDAPKLSAGVNFALGQTWLHLFVFNRAVARVTLGKFYDPRLVEAMKWMRVGCNVRDDKLRSFYAACYIALRDGDAGLFRQLAELCVAKPRKPRRNDDQARVLDAYNKCRFTTWSIKTRPKKKPADVPQEVHDSFDPAMSTPIPRIKQLQAESQKRKGKPVPLSAVVQKLSPRMKPSRVRTLLKALQLPFDNDL